MKITNVRAYVVENPWNPWFFVEVTTDDGLTGVGEGAGYHWSQANVAYSAAALSTVRWSLRKDRIKNTWELAGGGAAVCMLGGQALIIEAVKVNTAVALPLIHGVSVMFVAGLSSWLFQERFSLFSGAGLLTGILAIVLLALG